jgi:hypothetical protein
LKPDVLWVYLKIFKFFFNSCTVPYLFKNKIIFSFVKFMATERIHVGPQIFFLLGFCSCWIQDLWIREPGSGMEENQDPGSEILDEHLGSETLAQTSKFIHFKITFQTLLSP